MCVNANDYNIYSEKDPLMQSYKVNAQMYFIIKFIQSFKHQVYNCMATL